MLAGPEAISIKILNGNNLNKTYSDLAINMTENVTWDIPKIVMYE